MFCFHDFLGVSCIPLTCILSRFCLLICSFTILKVLLRKEVHSEQLLWNRSVDQIHKHVLSPSEPLLPSPSSEWRGRFGKVEFFPQTDAQLSQRSGTWTQSVPTVHHCYPNVSSRFFFLPDTLLGGNEIVLSALSFSSAPAVYSQQLFTTICSSKNTLTSTFLNWKIHQLVFRIRYCMYFELGRWHCHFRLQTPRISIAMTKS